MDARKSGILFVALCISLLLAGCVRPSQPITLEQIITNNEAAVHTRDSSGIRNMEIDLAMKDGKSAFDAVYMATRDGRMRINIIVDGKRVYTEAYDGHGGWDMAEDGTAPVIDQYAAALWHGTQFPGQIFGLRDVIGNGHKLEYIGRENIDSVDYCVLKITLTDGFETYRYINPASWMIERGRDFRAFHPAIDDKKTWVETVWSDYRPVDGVMHSFLSTNTNLTTGQWQATNTVKAIKINPDFDQAIFVKPADAAH